MTQEASNAKAATPAAPAKPKAEVELVKMKDGRTVSFAGKRKLVKEVSVDGKHVSVRFDFRNGETKTFKVPENILLHCAGHGASQKIGDEAAGLEDVEDMVVAVDSMIERLNKGEWSAPRAAGDGFSGASVVIRAICEHTGKTVDEIKAFLQKKLDATPGLTRAALYASFRSPNTATGKIIARLEAEKASKSSKGPSAEELLNELK